MVTSIAMLAETPVIYLLLPVMRENVKKNGSSEAENVRVFECLTSVL